MHGEKYTLKHQDTFAIFDALGNIAPSKDKETGLYYKGTRFLSRYELLLFDEPPLLLSSCIKDDNSVFTVDLTNFAFLNKSKKIPQGNIHIWRSKFLRNNTSYEKIHLKNYLSEPVELELSLCFDSDFVDIFEIRGFKRNKKGIFFKPRAKKDSLILTYKGIDNKLRKTQIHFSINADQVRDSRFLFKLRLKPQESFSFYIYVHCTIEDEVPEILSYGKALFLLKQWLKTWEEKGCKIITSNEQFNQWLRRSWADIIMLLSQTSNGIYPFAGIPWFAAPFGRDGIITALECLWLCPSIAKGTLKFLSATQAKEFDKEKDAEPGKIIHEIREGELASAGELPFAWYYGSVDATPLFVVLAGKYLDRTGDLEFLEEIWENIRLAIDWIDLYGDLDEDGFVEYVPSKKGLINKGWKDSWDSVFYENGELVRPPVALVEVQGYVYQAKKQAAKIAKALKRFPLYEKWNAEAEVLKEKLEKFFWCEEIGCYAVALDKDKKQCKVRTSNPGHLLFSEAISQKRANKLAELFFEKHFFSGWGIRTVSSLEKKYNPLSYHNGSIWPHDNAIIGYGFACYNLKKQCMRILKALFEASTFFKLHRIPELFCGFSRRRNEGPTHYPVACHPQAWAAGAVFLLLQGCLGISFKGNTLFLKYPILPKFIEELWIHDFKLSHGKLDLYFKNYGDDVGIRVLRKEGDVKLFIEK